MSSFYDVMDIVQGPGGTRTGFRSVIPVPSTWTRTFTAVGTNYYQVVLPFDPGEWEQNPLTGSYVEPFAWHPDGSVFLVKVYQNAQPGTHAITPTSAFQRPSAGNDTPVALPALPTFTVKQDNTPEGTYNLHTQSGWQEENKGKVARRYWQGRPISDGGEQCDFTFFIWLLYMDGNLVRGEVRLVSHLGDPAYYYKRNYPLLSASWQGSPIWTDVITEIQNDARNVFHKGKLSDGYSISYRTDGLVYAVSDGWSGRQIFAHRIDPTKPTGGSRARLQSDLAVFLSKPWYAEWGHALYAPSSGVWGDFGVCQLDVLDAFQNDDKSAWPALQVLCGEWITRPHHLVDVQGNILEQIENYPFNWSEGLGGENGLCRTGAQVCPDTKKSPKYPSQPPYVEDQYLHGGKTGEDGAHQTANGLMGLLHFAPTDLYLNEVLMRTKAIFNYASWRYLNSSGYALAGQIRHTARAATDLMEMLPFAEPTFRGQILQRLNAGPDPNNFDLSTGQLKLTIPWYKAAGYKGNFGPSPGAEEYPEWAAWQVAMFFGVCYGANISGYSDLALTTDEINTAQLTMQWIADNCIRKIGNTWQVGYHVHGDADRRNITSITQASPAVVSTAPVNHGLVSGQIADITWDSDLKKSIVTCTSSHGIDHSTSGGNLAYRIRGVLGAMGNLVNRDQAVRPLSGQPTKFELIGVDVSNQKYTGGGSWGQLINITEITGTMGALLNATGFSGAYPSPRWEINRLSNTTFELVGSDTQGASYSGGGFFHHPYSKFSHFGGVIGQSLAGFQWVLGDARALDYVNSYIAAESTADRWWPRR